ncbi:MAG TPA: tRNA uridine-5-carboxymethylaminomethyl(34) synthesis GTPase MnmE, partial [Candidatus Elarobacter sp.]|nr:tRNA uridine-5-carboxymethylaminomethyl(34) synthesis GTPase MnmE [Candidatus Elarobacter sp.]
MTAIGDDTIVALATPAGRGAVALVRLSGRNARAIAERHVTPWPLEPRRATLCAIRDERGAVLDEALVTLFVAPHSFTGEDVVEMTTHGGHVVPALVLAALIGSGARGALPGEFTRRAVMNGKLDLVQAEAIGDLVDAGSRAMQRAAIAQLDGGLSRRINALRDDVIGLEALIAYDIDFPEEDDGPIPRARVRAATRAVIEALTHLLATAPAGELVRTGAVVVIAGAPNAGKSSLFNALLGVSRAIVTEIPGTTRDAIEAVLDAGEWPIRLVDTAGLRETEDVVERVGIEVSARYLGGADVVLACADTDAGADHVIAHVAALTSAPVIGVRTKGDLGAPAGHLTVSAVTGLGLRELLDAVVATIGERYGAPELDAPILTRERQRYSVQRALDE